MSLIRCARLEDYAEVEAIMQQVQRLHMDWRPDIYREAKPVYSQEYFEQLISQNRLLVAEQNGCVAGILSYMYRHIESDKQVTRDVIFIDDLAVKGEYRCCGIGSQLLGFIKDKVKRERLDGLELQVNAKNLAARKMYEKNGFAEKSINLELLSCACSGIL